MFFVTPCVIFLLSVYPISDCYFAVLIASRLFTADSISSGWLRALPTVNDAAYVNDAIMLCGPVPCVSFGISSPSFVFPSPASFADSSFIYLHSFTLTFASFQLFLQIISCLVITFPLLIVPLPFATLRVCVCVFCVCLVAYGRALTAPTPG